MKKVQRIKQDRMFVETRKLLHKYAEGWLVPYKNMKNVGSSYNYYKAILLLVVSMKCDQRKPKILVNDTFFTSLKNRTEKKVHIIIMYKLCP